MFGRRKKEKEQADAAPAEPPKAETAKPEVKKPEPKKTEVKKPAAKPAAPAGEPAGNASKKTYHVTFNSDKNKWEVKATENQRANKTFVTKDEAVQYAKDLAKSNGGNVVTHLKDGKFQKKQ